MWRCIRIKQTNEQQQKQTNKNSNKPNKNHHNSLKTADNNDPKYSFLMGDLGGIINPLCEDKKLPLCVLSIIPVCLMSHHKHFFFVQSV